MLKKENNWLSGFSVINPCQYILDPYAFSFFKLLFFLVGVHNILISSIEFWRVGSNKSLPLSKIFSFFFFSFYSFRSFLFIMPVFIKFCKIFKKTENNGLVIQITVEIMGLSHTFSKGICTLANITNPIEIRTRLFD